MKKRRLISLLFVFLFAVFAFVNINDIDPLLWVSLYAFIGLLHLLIFFGKYDQRIIIFVGIGLCAYACFYVHTVWDWIIANDKIDLIGKMKADKPHIEGTREFGGLLIATFSLGYQLRLHKS